MSRSLTRLTRKKSSNRSIIVVVHNIRSVYNVGSIFRTADAGGVAGAALSGYTPSPIDEMGRARSDFKKTSLGAEAAIPWQKTKNIKQTIGNLQKDGYFVIALENAPNARDYRNIPKKHRRVAIVVGNEVRGLSKAVLRLCDDIVAIPMHGKKESLNVAVAFGIALYSYL